MTTKKLTLQLRGGELHGSTLKETDEYQSCTGYLCQKWIPKSSTYNQSKNSYNYRKYAYPYLRLPELFYNYAEADFEYNGSLSALEPRIPQPGAQTLRAAYASRIRGPWWAAFPRAANCARCCTRSVRSNSCSKDAVSTTCAAGRRLPR
ncbi:MAG: RagB/SusD family nutrient uptake outer membrane protein [Alistipes shahii]